MFFLLSILIKLYFYIGLGYFSAYLYKDVQKYISKILFYFVTPFLIFKTVMTMELSRANLSMPLFSYLFSSILALSFYSLSKKILKDERKHLIALCAGTSNCGYIGIPLASHLFAPPIVNNFIALVLGMILFENSLGFYLTAKRRNSVKACLYRLFQVPALHAFILALSLSSFGVSMSFHSDELLKSLFCFLGMMIVGAGLFNASSKEPFDISFTIITCLSKFLAAPLLMCLLIYLEKSYLGLYQSELHKAFLLYSFTPLAANSIALSTILNCQPEKAARAVTCSVIVALLYLPLMIRYFVL